MDIEIVKITISLLQFHAHYRRDYSADLISCPKSFCFNFCLKWDNGKSRKSEWYQTDAYVVNLAGTLQANVFRLIIIVLIQSWMNYGAKNGMECCTTFWQVSICSTGFPANVTYQELDVPLSRLPPQLRCFLPNVWYSGSSEHDHLRLVALVSTTDIEEGDEVFSTYYTVIHWSFLIIPFPVGSLTEAVKLEWVVCLWLLTADTYIQIMW
jgi:hypothetical protein